MMTIMNEMLDYKVQYLLKRLIGKISELKKASYDERNKDIESNCTVYGDAKYKAVMFHGGRYPRHGTVSNIDMTLGIFGITSIDMYRDIVYFFDDNGVIPDTHFDPEHTYTEEEWFQYSLLSEIPSLISVDVMNQILQFCKNLDEEYDCD